MTREEILDMSADQLAEAVAVHVMGWEWCEPTRIGNAVSSGYWWSLSLEEPVFDWNPGEDISAAWEVEETFKSDTGKQAAYVKCLKDVLGDNAYMFDFIHATPEQRCKAALLAVLEG